MCPLCESIVDSRLWSVFIGDCVMNCMLEKLYVCRVFCVNVLLVPACREPGLDSER